MSGKSNSDHRPCLSKQIRRNASSRRARLVALLFAATAVSVSTSAVADHPASIQRIGRWLGVGWGDGYHVCRDGGIRPGADLPPQSFPEQFGPSKPVDNCGEIYPPGAGLAAYHSNTAPCDQGICDAQPMVENQVVSSPVADHSHQEIRTQRPASTPTQPALIDDLDTPLPSWVDRAESQSGQASPPIDEADHAILGGPIREALKLDNDGNLDEPDPGEVASPSDFLLPNQPSPESDAKTSLGAPSTPNLKPNRLPPVLKNAEEKPADLDDSSYELLPSPAGRQLNDDSATSVINSPESQAPRAHDSLLDDSLLDDSLLDDSLLDDSLLDDSLLDDSLLDDSLLDDSLLDDNLLHDNLLDQGSLIDKRPHHEFGIPAVKENPFFETKTRASAPSNGRVITRIAKRPRDTRPRQSTQDSNVIHQPD